MVTALSPRARIDGDATLRSPVRPHVMSALLAALRSAMGSFSLVDMTLPRGMSGGAEREVLFGCGSDLSEMERNFLGRFRQSGGHREMPFPKSGSAHAPAGGEMADLLAQSSKPVMLVNALSQAESLLDMIAANMSLLVPASAPRRASMSPAMASRLQRHRIVACKGASLGRTFLWFVPETEFDLACDRLKLEPATRRRSHDKLGSARPGRRAIVADATLELPTLPDEPWRSSLVAGMLIHDGGYRSEREGDYCWLWTGPSNHFRMLLTGVPPTPAKLHVSVIKTEDVRNLSGLRMLVNGRHVPHRFEPLSALSGKLLVDLPLPAEDLMVLSLVCPHMTQDGNGGRLLGLCIDRIEMLS